MYKANIYLPHSLLFLSLKLKKTNQKALLVDRGSPSTIVLFSAFKENEKKYHFIATTTADIRFVPLIIAH